MTEIHKCVIEVEGKNEDTSSSVTCIIDVPLSLTYCSGRDVLLKLRERISSVTCIIDVPLSLTACSGRDRQSVLLKWRERMKTPVVQ